MTRRQLDERVLAWIGEGAEPAAGGAPDDARFDALALELFAYQYEHNVPYRQLCTAFGTKPSEVGRWQDIPCVPTGVFKEARLASFPPERDVGVFRTSGTSEDRRGALHLDTLRLYDASLLQTFGAYVCPDAERIRFAVLAPDADAAPDSSLSYMFARAVHQFGAPGSRFYVGPEGLDRRALIADLGSAAEPVAVVGTAFAFVHLLDALAAARTSLALPRGSRVMETGGFKGRSRTLPRAELHAGIADALGLSRERIVNQYGMCELASQFYEPTLCLGETTAVKRVPPWVRTRVVDPLTLEAVPPGERGALVHYDLANTGSVLAVQTSDEGRAAPGGFEVFGRLAGAEERGCSIAADALLADAGR